MKKYTLTNRTAAFREAGSVPPVRVGAGQSVEITEAQYKNSAVQKSLNSWAKVTITEEKQMKVEPIQKLMDGPQTPLNPVVEEVPEEIVDPSGEDTQKIGPPEPDSEPEKDGTELLTKDRPEKHGGRRKGRGGKKGR